MYLNSKLNHLSVLRSQCGTYNKSPLNSRFCINLQVNTDSGVWSSRFKYHDQPKKPIQRAPETHKNTIINGDCQVRLEVASSNAIMRKRAADSRNEYPRKSIFLRDSWVMRYLMLRFGRDVKYGNFRGIATASSIKAMNAAGTLGTWTVSA